MPLNMKRSYAGVDGLKYSQYERLAYYPPNYTSLSPKSLTYRIRFWEGDTFSTEKRYTENDNYYNKKSKASTLFVYDSNKEKVASGGIYMKDLSTNSYMTKTDVANMYIEWINQWNLLKLPIILTHVEEDNGEKYINQTENDGGNSTISEGECWILLTGEGISSGGWGQNKSNLVWIVCRLGGGYSKNGYGYFMHELAHALGIGHEGDTRENSEKTILYGNHHLEKMPFHKGFLSPAPGWYGGIAGIHATGEDEVNFCDVMYNTDSSYYNAKIYGYIDKTYNSNTDSWSANNSKIDYYNSDGTKTSIPTKYIFDKTKNANAEVLLFDTYRKEAFYRMPVDIDGYFEFRIRVIPDQSISRFRVLLLSEHFYRKMIYKEREDTTTSWDNIEPIYKPEDGYIYYGIADVPKITTNTKNYQISSLTFTKNAKTLKDIEEDVGLYLEYNTSFGSSVYVEYSSTKRYFECIKSHKSSLWNKPLKDETSRWYWRETIKTNDNKWMADKDYIGKYKNEVTSNIKLQEYNKANNLAVCGIDKFPK